MSADSKTVLLLISLAVTASGLVLLAATALLGLFRRPRKTFAGIMTTAVSAVIAFAAALLLRGAAANFAVMAADAALKSGGSSFTVAELAESGPTLVALIRSFAGAAAAPAIFVTVFVLIKLLFCAFNPLIAKVFPKDSPSGAAGRLTGLGVGIVNGIAILVMLFMPLGGTVSLAEKLADSPETASFIESVGEYAGFDGELPPGALSKNPVLLSTRRLGGEAIFYSLTKVRFGDEKRPVDEVIESLAAPAATALDLARAADNGTAALLSSSGLVRSFVSDLEANPDIPDILSELLSSAGRAWAAENDFLGIAPPQTDGSGIIEALLKVLSEITSKTLTDDLGCAADLMEILDRSGLITGGEDGQLSFNRETLSEPGFISDILCKISEVPNMQPVADSLTEAAIGALADAVGLNGDEKEDLLDRISVELAEMTPEKAEQIEKMIVSAMKVSDSVDGKSPSDILTGLDTDALKDMLDAADGSGIIDGGTDKLLEVIVNSEKIKDSGIIDEKTAEKIANGGSGEVVNTVAAAQKSAAIVKELSEGQPDSKSVEEKLEWLSENLDKDTVDTLKEQLTEEKLTSIGIPPQQAPGLQKLINNILSELSAAEGNGVDMSKETAALTTLYSLAIGTGATSGQEISGNLFGSEPGKTDAGTLVSSVMSSQVISVALVKTVYETETPQIDPIECGIKLSESDRTALTNALNASLKEGMSLTGDEAELFKKKIVSIAAMFGEAGTVGADWTFKG